MDSLPEHTKLFLFGSPPVDFSRPTDLSEIRGRTAIVTGGASGIGRGIARALAEHGVKVVIVDINDSGQQVAANLVTEGFEALFIKTVVVSWDSQLAAFKSTLAWSASIDIVVAAAGIASTDLRRRFVFKDGRSATEPSRPLTKVLDVNLHGVYWTTDLALWYFNKLHAKSSSLSATSFSPQLLLISSTAGFIPAPFAADYSAAKWGVRGLWKSIRMPTKTGAQWQANLLVPGFTRTPTIEKHVDKIAAMGCRVATVDETVRVALRLIGDREIFARAVCVAGTDGKHIDPEQDGGKGSGTFDLHDELGDRDNIMLRKFEEGVFEGYILPV